MKIEIESLKAQNRPFVMLFEIYYKGLHILNLGNINSVHFHYFAVFSLTALYLTHILLSVIRNIFFSFCFCALSSKYNLYNP